MSDPADLWARPLIVMALEVESGGQLETLGWPVAYVGVGKLNAAYGLMKALATHTPSLVINAGSAGSPSYQTGETVAAHRFVQRDMDATGLGFVHGETPFDALETMLVHPPVFTSLSDGVCGSGDSFLQGPPPMPCEIIDMEAYAFARICALESVPFACLKYITDGADHAAHDDWNVNVKRAADALTSTLRQHVTA